MKKLWCIWLIIGCLMQGSAAAWAAEMDDEAYTDVPSVMTQDSVQHFTAEPCGQVEVLQPWQESAELLEELYDFVWNQLKRPVRFYDEETQSRIQALMPEADMDSLYMTEFMGMQLSLTDENAESVDVSAEFETDYTPGQLIIAVLGIRNDEGDYSWYPYRGDVPETGMICWTMPMDEFAELTQERIVLHILTLRPGTGNQADESAAQPETAVRPSKQAGDLTYIGSWKSTTNAEMDDQFRIYFTDLTQSMQDEISHIEAGIREGKSPIDCFPETIRMQAQEAKQDGMPVDGMVIYDIAAVMAENYQDTYGDVATESCFPTSYSAEKEMFALLGFWTGENFEWYYLRANGLEGTENAEIVYRQLILPTMEEEPAMLIVFSEPLTEDEAKE